MRMVIIRGIPGSAKSTISKAFVAQGYSHYEADMYFMHDGVYQFDINKIQDAHEWCQQWVEIELASERDVVVSNTFTTIRELKPYFDIAKKFGIVPNVIVCQNQFKDIHNVPCETLERMKRRFVYDISELFE